MMAASSRRATTVEVKDSVSTFDLKLPARLLVSDVEYATSWFSDEISRDAGVTFLFGWDAGWKCRCAMYFEPYDPYDLDCVCCKPGPDSFCGDHCDLARKVYVDAAYADGSKIKKGIKISSMKLVAPDFPREKIIRLYDPKQHGSVPSKWVNSDDLSKRLLVKLAKSEQSITLRLAIDLVLPPQVN